MLNQINADLKEAMKSKDVAKLGVLRMLLASLKNKKIELKKDELSDEDVLAVVKSEIKKRKDSLESYVSGGREDLAEQEKKEIEILEKYMPEQMSEEEIEKIAKETAETLGAQGMQDFGRVMGALMGKLQGRADGNLASKVLKKVLTEK